MMEIMYSLRVAIRRRTIQWWSLLIPVSVPYLSLGLDVNLILNSQEYHELYAHHPHLLAFSADHYSDLAKISPHVLHPERFALHLGTFLVSKYAHLSKAFITVEKVFGLFLGSCSNY
jgi:hypothetical protein